MVAVCWGALAIGGAYPWAYWPLAMICAATGIMGLRADRTAGATSDGAGVSRRLSIVLGAVGAAMLLQIVPMPLAWLRTISPQTIGVLADTDFSYGAGLVRFHALSLDPASTGAALALYGAFAMMLVGMARVFGIDREASRRFVEVLTVFGVVLALVGIVQKPLYTGKVLGVWEPEAIGIPFGPFVNRNHFAGWMLMALPLALGLLCAGLEQGMRGLRPGLRYRILWLSSPEASRLILLGAAALVMAMSLVLTMSRSGISALMVSLMLMGWTIARGVKGRSRRTAAGVFLVVLFVTAIGWVGADVIVARFSDANWAGFNNRTGAWADALHVASVFPATGTGVNTYETAARFYQRHDLGQFYGESHNDYLELLAEGGAMVGVPILLALVLLTREIRARMKEDPPTTIWWIRRGAITGLFAIGLQETVDFSLQLPGNAVMFVILCAIALHRPRAERQQAPQPQPAPSRPRLRVVASNAIRVEVGP